MTPQERRAYDKARYQANKAAHRARTRTNSLRLKAEVDEFLTAYLSTHPCVDCGEADPVVLDFDHIDRENKLFSVANWQRTRGAGNLAAVVVEVAKCAVRCANCHRKKTYREFERRSKGELW